MSKIKKEVSRNICSKCGKLLFVQPDGFGMCPDGHGKLIMPSAFDSEALLKLQRRHDSDIKRRKKEEMISKLPLAVRVNGEKWTVFINGRNRITTIIKPAKFYKKASPLLPCYGEMFCRVNSCQWAKFIHPSHIKEDRTIGIQ